MMNNTHLTLLSLPLLALFCVACNSSNAESSSAYPSDEQVIRDVTPSNKEGLIDVQVVPGKEGEAYLHPSDMNWYWDRGVVVKRKAEITGVPNAVLIVGGLARYQKMGNQYKYAKFLTTYNEYAGIPAPSNQTLVQFVKDNLKKVFISRDHNITEISEVAIDQSRPWVWHTANSFTIPFTFRYKQIASYTQIDEHEDVMDVRFYRNAVDAPIHTLMASTKNSIILGSQAFSQDEVNSMKTLRTSFK